MRIIICIILALIITMAFIIININKINREHFIIESENKNKLFIKKTTNLNKIFSNSK